MAPNSTQTGDQGNGSRNIRDMINGDTSSNQNSRPSTPAVAPATTQGTTNKRLPPKLTIPEIIALKNEVVDATSGKKFLMRTKLASMEKPLTTDALKETLLHIIQLAGITLPTKFLSSPQWPTQHSPPTSSQTFQSHLSSLQYPTQHSLTTGPRSPQRLVTSPTTKKFEMSPVS